MPLVNYFDSAASHYSDWIDATLKKENRRSLLKHDKEKGIANARKAFKELGNTTLLSRLQAMYQARAGNWFSNRLHRHSFENFLLATIIQSILQDASSTVATTLKEKLKKDYGYESFNPENFITQFLSFGTKNKYDYLELLLIEPIDFNMPMTAATAVIETPAVNEAEKMSSMPFSPNQSDLPESAASQTSSISDVDSENGDENHRLEEAEEIAALKNAQKKLTDELSEIRIQLGITKSLQSTNDNLVNQSTGALNEFQQEILKLKNMHDICLAELRMLQQVQSDLENFFLHADFQLTPINVEPSIVEVFKNIIQLLLQKKTGKIGWSPGQQLRNNLITTIKDTHSKFDFVSEIGSRQAIDVSAITGSNRDYFNVIIIFILLLDDKSSAAKTYRDLTGNYQAAFSMITDSVTAGNESKKYLRNTPLVPDFFIGLFQRLQKWLLSNRTDYSPALCKQLQFYSQHERTIRFNKLAVEINAKTVELEGYATAIKNQQRQQDVQIAHIQKLREEGIQSALQYTAAQEAMNRLQQELDIIAVKLSTKQSTIPLARQQFVLESVRRPTPNPTTEQKLLEMVDDLKKQVEDLTAKLQAAAAPTPTMPIINPPLQPILSFPPPPPPPPPPLLLTTGSTLKKKKPEPQVLSTAPPALSGMSDVLKGISAGQNNLKKVSSLARENRAEASPARDDRAELMASITAQQFKLKKVSQNEIDAFKLKPPVVPKSRLRSGQVTRLPVTHTETAHSEVNIAVTLFDVISKRNKVMRTSSSSESSGNWDSDTANSPPSP